MNVACPSCETTFRIDLEEIGAKGRRVRCGACGHEWTQMPLEEAAVAPEAKAEPGAEPGAEPETEAELEVAEVEGEAEAAPEPAPEAEEEAEAPPVDLKAAAGARRPAPPRRRPEPQRSAGNRRVAAGWVVFLLVLGGLLGGAYFGQAQIVAAVPAAAELYRMAGLQDEPPLGEGLELRSVKSERRLIDGQRVVVIEGLVANVSGEARPVPQLRASVTDGAGAPVEEWTFSAKVSELPPGGVTEFETSTRNAPNEGSLGIDFVASR